jgi:transposase-like protein
VFRTIRGERHYLRRAVDQDGSVLDILVQRRRDKKAAKKFLRNPRRHLLSATAYRQEMIQRFQSWQEMTELAAA